MRGSTTVYINGRFLCQEATGVQKFALGVTAALQKIHPEFRVLGPKGQYNQHGLTVTKTGWGGTFFWEQCWLPLYFLFHPGFLLINLCNSAPLMVRKQVVTIHDLAFRKDTPWFSKKFRCWYNFLIPRLCRRSLEILTVSGFIKQELCAEFSLSAEKITVVHNGIPEMAFDEQKPYAFKYILLTGIYNPRKNAAFVLSKLEEIKKRNYHIVGVGAAAPIFGGVEFAQDDHLHLLPYVDDATYYTLMKHAEVLIFPSTYEGFGIPVLEALTLGTPVMVPDLPVYRASFGELPLYYTAGDANSLLSVLDQINIHKPAAEDRSDLKKKYTFDNSANILSVIARPYLAKKTSQKNNGS